MKEWKDEEAKRRGGEEGKEDEEERACGLRQRAGVPETGWVVGGGVEEWEDKEDGGECCG